jgi:hypothetical protein
MPNGNDFELEDLAKLAMACFMILLQRLHRDIKENLNKSHAE